MIELTQQVVDFVAPEHGRTSCSDKDLGNSWGGRDSRGNIVHPRCVRCYLLEHLGQDTDTLEFQISPMLIWKGDL
jgi:hypothetical protein